MKKTDVRIGGIYQIKVAGNLVAVKIDSEHPNGGWTGISQKTGKAIRIKSPQRLRRRLVDPGHIKAIHAADQANARLAEERAKAPDGQTASERAMAESAARAAAAAEAATEAAGEPGGHTGERAATTPAPGERTADANGKAMSCLDAAAKVLQEAGEPMNTLAMFDAMVAGGYWTSDKATPQNTIHAAILREITRKGDASRFRKASERGKFELTR